MSELVDAIVLGAAQLPPDQRLTVAHRILTSIEPEPSPTTDVTWDLGIRERIARYDRGETRAIPAEEVFAELDRRLKR